MDIDDACEPPTEMTPHEMHEYSDDIAARDRHCWVFPNGDDSFHLLLTDDSGGFISPTAYSTKSAHDGSPLSSMPQ
jgi:hypothetical protein